jgi:coatomer protein complex subunit epsilon
LSSEPSLITSYTSPQNAHKHNPHTFPLYLSQKPNLGNYTQVISETTSSRTRASANQATTHQLDLFLFRSLIATKNYTRVAQEITESHGLGLQALKAQAVYLDAVQSADAAGRDAALAHLRDLLLVHSPDDRQPEVTALEVKVVVGQVLATEGLVEEALTVLLPHNNHLER